MGLLPKGMSDFDDGHDPLRFSRKEQLDMGFPRADDNIPVFKRLSQLSADRQAAADDYAKQLENEGFTIFHARTENDDISVEADYGAPARGLDFFPDLINKKRSYRYTKVRNVEGEHRTHWEEATRIGAYLKSKGFQIFQDLKSGQYPSQIHFVNGGVTRAFTETVNLIAKENAEVTAARDAVGMPAYKKAFFIPVPTYGLFYFQLQKLLSGTDIEIINIHRNDDGSVCQASLDAMIEHCREKNVRILGYYDCNPHNPSGHIRTEDETRLTAEKLQRESKRYIAEDEPLLEALFKDDSIKKDGLHRERMRAGMHIDKPQHGIVIIDDMAYEGLEHSTVKKPFSFGQVSPEIAERTVVLKGMSKIGLPGVRIGLMVGPIEMIGPHLLPALYDEFAASSIGVDIITARYSYGPHRKKFDAHMRNLRRIHRHRSGIVEAFVNGLDGTDRLTEWQKNHLTRKYAQYAGLKRDEAREHLESGLPAFHIQHDVECGFFMNLNMSNLEGRMIALKHDDKPFPELWPIFYSGTLWSVFKAFDIDVVTAGSQGNSPFALQARVTLSLEENELLRLYTNLRKMHAHFFGEKPETQMDLFRKNPAQTLGLSRLPAPA